MNHKAPNESSPVAVFGLSSCVALTALFVCVVIWPMILHRQAAVDREAELIADKAKTAQFASAITRAKTNLQSVRAEIAGSQWALEPQGHLNNRVAGITNLAKKCGLEIEEINPGSTLAGSQYDSLALKLTGRGSYRGCVTFMHQLHDHYPDTAIGGFRITVGGQEAGGPLSMEFNLVWFAKPATTAQAE
jgi:Tfp pilus assembly protein PilO